MFQQIEGFGGILDAFQLLRTLLRARVGDEGQHVGERVEHAAGLLQPALCGGDRLQEIPVVGKRAAGEMDDARILRGHEIFQHERIAVPAVAVMHQQFGPENILVVVHLEARLGGLDDLPDHDGRDLDRVALDVVDLQLLALEVADTLRNPLLGVERVGPPQPRFFHGAHVASEQLQHLPFVRVHDEQAAETDQAHRLHDRRRARLARDTVSS